MLLKSLPEPAQPLDPESGTYEQQAREPTKRYVSLCVTRLGPSEHCSIDLTNVTNDQALFQAIAETYNAVTNGSIWAQRVTAVLSACIPALPRIGFRGVDLFIPRHVDIVSVSPCGNRAQKSGVGRFC